jgi:hypothetical protein
LLALCGFALMGLTHGVAIVTSPPGSGYINRK